MSPQSGSVSHGTVAGTAVNIHSPRSNYYGLATIIARLATVRFFRNFNT